MLNRNMIRTATALTMLMAGGAAFAQTATVVEAPPAQETAVVPDVAKEPKAPAGTAEYDGFPTFTQAQNDKDIANTLLAQGFSDVVIERTGSLMTVTAQREGKDIKLVYNLVEGRLIEVNGERILTEEEKTLAPSTTGASATPAADQAASKEIEKAAESAGTDAKEGTAPDAPAEGTTDSGSTDGATTDGSTDGAATDSGTTDGATTDSGATDGASTDSGSTDSGSTDGAATN